MPEPKEPKRTGISWSPPGEVHANMHEVLFWSLLLVRNAERVGDLDKWAIKACSEYSAASTLMKEWKPPDTFDTYKQVSAIFAPMVDAMNRSWGLDELATIGTAMRAATWHAGQHDDLDARRLHDHLDANRRGVRPPGSRREGPQRWRTWAIVLVAAAMQRRIESGISDTVEGMNPIDPPPFDQALVGKQLEVLWKYTNIETGEPQLIWATGRVARVADGLTDKRSSRAQKILPAGAVLWAWDADPDFGEQAGEQWLMLLPKKWNPHKQAQLYSWRYDPREFGAARAAPERPQNVRRVADACA